MTVKELRAFLEKYADEDLVRFFTEKGTKEFMKITILRDDTFFKNVAIIELD